MENFSYHVPFYVVTGGIDTAGHSSELTSGQVGLFDRQTFSVATGSGNGKEFFFAQGSIGGKDWYGRPVTESHKSPFFYGKDVESIYVSHPKEVKNEEWVIGYNGSASSVGLSYEKGKAIRVKFYFHGQPIYRFFNGPKEYVVSYTPKENCVSPCEANDCPEGITDCLDHTKELINHINNHVELQKFGVKAQLVTNPFSSTPTNMTKYQLKVCDNGDSVSLHAVQAQVAPDQVTRVKREGSISTYEICVPSNRQGEPAPFQQKGSVLAAVCGDCPDGSTLSAASDVYIVKRNLSGTDTLAGVATAVDTAYNATSAVALGQDGGMAIIKIKVAAGTSVSALVADIVEFSHSEAAVCTFEDADPISWVESGSGIRGKRTLKLKSINRADCDAEGNRLDDIYHAIEGVDGIDLESLEVIEGTSCADDYTVEQWSNDCLSEEDCATNVVTFNYTLVPAFENRQWEEVPVVSQENANRKCGIRVTAGYIDPKFGDCSFDPLDYYETEPIKLELSLLNEDEDACDVAYWPTVLQTRVGQIGRQSGEYIIREVVMKNDAYLKHVDQFSMKPREREAFDQNLLSTVDRNAMYTLYYVTYKASYGKSYRKNEQEKFTTVFAFKNGDASQQTFKTSIVDVLTAKSGVALEVNS
jgi:hypothetical protein